MVLEWVWCPGPSGGLIDKVRCDEGLFGDISVGTVTDETIQFEYWRQLHGLRAGSFPCLVVWLGHFERGGRQLTLKRQSSRGRHSVCLLSQLFHGSMERDGRRPDFHFPLTWSSMIVSPFILIRMAGEVHEGRANLVVVNESWWSGSSTLTPADFENFKKLNLIHLHFE